MATKTKTPIPESAPDVTERFGGRFAPVNFPLDQQWGTLKAGMTVTTKDGTPLCVRAGRDKSSGGWVEVCIPDSEDSLRIHWRALASMTAEPVTAAMPTALPKPLKSPSLSMHSEEDCAAEEARVAEQMGPMRPAEGDEQYGSDDVVVWDGHDLSPPPEVAHDVAERANAWTGEGDSMFVVVHPKDARRVVVEVKFVTERDERVFMMGRVVQGAERYTGQLVRFELQWACQLAVEEPTLAPAEGEAEGEDDDADDADYEEGEGEEDDDDDEDDGTGVFGEDEAPALSSRQLCLVDGESDAGSTTSSKKRGATKETLEEGLARMDLENALSHAKAKLGYAYNHKAKKSTIDPLKQAVKEAKEAYSAAGLLGALLNTACVVRREPTPSPRKAAHPPSPAMEAPAFATATALHPVLAAEAAKRFDAVLKTAAEAECTHTYFRSVAGGGFELRPMGVASRAQCLEAAVRIHWSSITAFDRANFDAILRAVREGGAAKALLEELEALKPAPAPPRSRGSSSSAPSPSVVASDRKRARSAGPSTVANPPAAKRARK